MLGSFLKHQFLPLAKYSFYSGNITYKVVENISNLFERCKELLDTNGNDWRNPITDFSQFSSYIEPISLTTQLNDAEAMKSCACLATNQNDDNDDEEMIVPLPKMEIDEDDALSTIWLPLKRKHIFNINSKASTFILFRFFVTVSQCYKYQNIDQSIFNQRLKVWLLENISPYLNDDKLYPAFGGVLRIFKTIKGPNDVNIQINKHRKVKQKRLRLNLLQNNELHSENNEENLNSDDNYNNDLWIAIALAAFTTGVIIIIIYMLINCCCSNKKVKYSKPTRKLSCMQKLINFFKHNTHQPDPDEFHTFSKKSSKQRVNFENEKQLKSRLKGKKKSMDRMKLPLLHNLTESEEDILEVNPTNKSWSGSSIVSQNDSKNQSKFRITESSEDEQETKSKSSKFLNKIRSLSPSRFRKQKS
ncbi:CLUMA_CG010086, isoform A [Clunio marinus]|uniref:CLUMA_CG010086, isoform A n=1 Tax=Clunio marinus TaxID=568069 RepID=A0A1J1I8K6_9DIPT|nr:CLUMA_CG010086, isoform A [Clunio marinus]